MSKLNVKLPDTSDSLHLKVPDTTNNVWVKLPTPPQIQKLTCGGDSLTDETFLNYNVADWSALPDADPMPQGEVNSIAYNPAGTLFAVGKAGAPTLIMYNAETLTSIPGTPTPTGLVRDVIFNKAGTLFAYSSSSKVFVYSAPDWGFIRELTLPAQVEAIDFNYAGTLLAVGISGFAGDYLHIYDTTTWLRISGPSGGDEPDGAVVSVDFSPDDALLAAANQFSSTRNLNIYNTVTWSKLNDPSGVTTAQALDCTFNNAQTELLFLQASGVYFVRWDTSTWTILGGTPTITNQPNSIAINENDSHVAIGTATGGSLPTLEVYNTATWMQETLSPLPPSARRITTADFQPNF